MKLAAELSKRATGNTFYILDEPTTGLHFEDVRVLLEVLHRLVDLGNTVVVIEHNLHVVKTADWVIDLGPEGGEDGGEIVAEGTPEEVAEWKSSYTGHHLAPYAVSSRRPLKPGLSPDHLSSSIIASKKKRFSSRKVPGWGLRWVRYVYGGTHDVFKGLVRCGALSY